MAGGGFSSGKCGRRRRVWGGWGVRVGTGKGTGKSMRESLSKLPFGKLPL